MYGYNNYQYPTYVNTGLPDYRQQMQLPQQQSTQQQNTTQNNGMIWVQGEAGAKSYLIAPGNTVMLMDAENSVFYLKSADASGMPMPLRIFDYKERTETAPQAFIAPATAQNVNFDNFVTREEFEQRMASIGSGCKCKESKKNKLTEDATDGE